MKQAVLIILLFSSSRCFGQEFVTPDNKDESFNGVLYEITDTSRVLTKVNIDRNGILKRISLLDTSIHTDHLFFLNDSIILYEGRYDNNEYFFNLHSKKIKELPTCCFGAISNDKRYFAVGHTMSGFNGSIIYRLYPDSISYIGKMRDGYEITGALGPNRFIASPYISYKRKRLEIILDPDMNTVLDTLPESIKDRVQEGSGENDLIYIERDKKRQEITDHVISYNFLNKLYDTLLSSPLISRVDHIPNSDLYLFVGYMSREELNKDEDSIQKIRDYSDKKRSKINITLCDLYEPISGYRTIGNSKTKKMKKIPFDFYDFVFSSSGRHILFSKKVGDGSKITILSVKEFMEGM